MTESKLNAWFGQRDAKKLIKALKEGDFAARALAAKYLGELRAIEAIPDLKRAVDDPVKLVVEAAAFALKNMSVDPETSIRIAKRLEELQRLETRHRENLETVVALRGDPHELEMKKMKEIYVLSEARRLAVRDREKTNKLLLGALTFLGFIAVLSWLVKFLTM